MADYRDLAAALGGGYGQDTGGITPDTLITLKGGKKATASDLLGMIKEVGAGSLSNLESLIRGSVAQVPGAGGDLEGLARMGINKAFGAGGVSVSPTPVLPTTTDILGMMPRVTATRPETAGMEELGGYMAPATAKLAGKVIKATEGLPVGMGIKPINLNKGIYKPELTMEEMLKVKDIPTVDRVRQSIDLVGEKEFEKMVNAQYSKYKPSNVDQEAMLVESVTLDILGKAQRSPYPQQAALPTQYPLAPAGTRYEEFGGKLTYMTPDEFLQQVRPLKLDAESLDNIAALKSHVQAGGKLDPLHIYASGKEDGRHRAYLAKELGIEKIPVAIHKK